MADIIFDKVSKSFGPTQVIKNLDLRIADQEFMVFVGPSGCGKSTALRMIAGLESVTSGRISIGGRVVNDIEPRDRDVAIVLQSYALYPHKTVRQNIEFALRIRRTPKPEMDRLVNEVAATLGLTPFLDRHPRALSGGQRQRVALGRAIVRRPQAFLFDEPLSNLDAELRVTMRAEIVKLHRKYSTTTVYVTHDQIEAMTMGDRIAVLAPFDPKAETNLMQCGTPMELYHEPANVFVAQFIGSPRMNVFEAAVDHGGDVFVIDGVHRIPIPDQWRGVAEKLDGRKALVGIRPEHLRVARDMERSVGTMAGTVEFVEILGDEAIIHLMIGGRMAAVKTPGGETPPRAGELVRLRPDPTAMHLFDAAAHVRLGPGGRGRG